MVEHRERDHLEVVHSLILPSGLKVIYDTRTQTAELYDLSKDPGELQDLSANTELLAEPLATLHAFFEAHRNKTPGYQPPYSVLLCSDVTLRNSDLWSY